MKQMIKAIGFTVLVTVNSASAGWLGAFKEKATSYIKEQTVEYMPYLKKPETYMIAAAAAAGTYLIGRELYWGIKSELPLARAKNYVHLGLAETIKNQDARDRIEELVLNAPVMKDLGAGLIKKQDLNRVLNFSKIQYEFNDLKGMGRAFDWEVNNVPVFDHSALVSPQEGVRCGYHAAYNAELLWRAVRSKYYQAVTFEEFKIGPPIASWKDLAKKEFGAENYNNATEDINDAIITRLMTGCLNVSSEDFTVIANPWQNPCQFDEHLPGIIRALQQHSKQAHIFLLGNMRDIGSVGGSGGHWIAAVVTSSSEDGLKVHVADSISERLEGRMQVVEQLTELLQINPEWAAMQGGIASNLESAETILEQNGNYTDCYERLRTVYKSIKEADASIQAKFRTCYGEMMQRLLIALDKQRGLIASARAASSSSAASLSVDSALLEMQQFFIDPQHVNDEECSCSLSAMGSSSRVVD